MPRTAHTLCRRGSSRLKATKSLKRDLLTSSFGWMVFRLYARVFALVDTTWKDIHGNPRRVIVLHGHEITLDDEAAAGFMAHLLDAPLGMATPRPSSVEDAA